MSKKFIVAKYAGISLITLANKDKRKGFKVQYFLQPILLSNYITKLGSSSDQQSECLPISYAWYAK